MQTEQIAVLHQEIRTATDALYRALTTLSVSALHDTPPSDLQRLTASLRDLEQTLVSVVRRLDARRAV